MPNAANQLGVLADLRRAIAWDGVPSALRQLNAFSNHRFTGLFLFDGDLLKNIFIHDRQDAAANLFPVKPADYSYCLTVKTSGQPFHVVDALRDQRVAGHPSRHQVQSYYGVPLRDQQGDIFGTVCSFSLEPCEAGDQEVLLLDGFAQILLECERLGEIGWRAKEG